MHPIVHQIRTDDGAYLAVHQLAGDDRQPPLLISHATGFHAHCYQPIAELLADRYSVLALDHRGHGQSVAPDGWQVDWRAFGTDTAAVAHEIAPDGGIIGVGHSMGAASLLMAAHAEPALFSHLVLFEPISHPPRPDRPEVDMRSLPIVQGALRRRRTFPSREVALENYASKPPMSLMTPAVLANYVDYGFRTMASTGEIELCCDPEFEASIFVTGRDNGVWELLPEIETPCTVVGGMVEETQPSASTEPIAGQLPNGQYVLFDHQTHFGPFSHPDEIAALVP